MTDIVRHKGYTARACYDASTQRIYGRVDGIGAEIAFETAQSAAVTPAFAEAVERYLARCAAEGTAPERQYRGLFNVRLKPETHQALALWALTHDMTLNSAVEEALVQFLRTQDESQ
ncbi:MAG: type II toxin-antitoxin system HicB family antitoxin [Peptococcaceae bacterium]|uniref:type II toxin-antitoxin system HicB family antitoxin n=1 Tax=Kluyvera georgiana TaxID=73098 RepID=UPI002EA7FBCB|nr:type II toxin-antitoxin system HicB family antitoxin [Peptococcaceae bacterium]